MRSAVRSAAASAGGARAAGPGADGGVVDDEPSRDDRDAEGSGQVGLPVVQRLLGGRVALGRRAQLRAAARGCGVVRARAVGAGT